MVQDSKTDLPPIDSKPVSLVTGPTPGTKRNSTSKSKYDEYKQSSSLPKPRSSLPQQQPPPPTRYKPPTAHSNYLQPTAASKKRVGSSSSSSKRDTTSTYSTAPSSSSSAYAPKTPLKDKNTKPRPRKASSSSSSSSGTSSSANRRPPLTQQQQPLSNPRYSTPPTRITSSKSYNKGPTSSHGSVNPPPVVRTAHSHSSSNLNSYHNEVVYDEEDPELQMALQMSCIYIYIYIYYIIL